MGKYMYSCIPSVSFPALPSVARFFSSHFHRLEQPRLYLSLAPFNSELSASQTIPLTMANPNRNEQLEDLRNITTLDDFYDKLAAGKIASVGSQSPSAAQQPYYIPVPITLKAQLGSPTALAIGAFATTLTTLSFALMEWRGVSVTNAFIGDFFAVAGVGMLITAQWEIVLGNTYACQSPTCCESVRGMS